MSNKTYNKLMGLLDIVENELNTIAEAVGHESFKQWSKAYE